MPPAAGEHVPGLSLLLSVISLALVFGAVGGAIPVSVLPDAPDGVLTVIPHLNAVISALAIAVIGRGWVAIRRGNVTRHRLAMSTGFALFLSFLVLYLYKVAIEGPTAFRGPDLVYTYAYLPLLAIHVVLAIVCLPLLYYVLLLALTRPTAALGTTNHPRVGRVTVVLWLASFALGLAVYAMLYAIPFASG